MNRITRILNEHISNKASEMLIARLTSPIYIPLLHERKEIKPSILENELNRMFKRG